VAWNPVAITLDTFVYQLASGTKLEHKTRSEVAGSQVMGPSIVGSDEVAEVGGDTKSIFVVVVGPQALLQPRCFIKYRATLCEGWGRAWSYAALRYIHENCDKCTCHFQVAEFLRG